ncbi:hypothetical protein GF325_05250 [Candidatus Bathyarchaeota archaeon]|nr:hypothetical protein [Candidatus Bathyarchaeota archaeon]
MGSEDIVFYFDLADNGVVSKKTLVSQVKKFISKREKFDPSCNWGIVVFRTGECNPTFMESLVEDEDGLDSFLGKNLKFTEQAHPIEQGLMLASTYLIEAFRTTRDKTLRVIVVSDGPSDESTVELANALMEMLEPMVFFPLHVDIIRVGNQRVYTDDVKLQLLTNMTGGSLHYTDSNKSFKTIMGELLTRTREQEGIHIIPEKHHQFFENLGFSLSLVQGANAPCSACSDSLAGWTGQVLCCGNCGAVYHEACVKELARTSFQSMATMMRCANCDGLITTTEVKPGKLQSAASPPIKDHPSGEQPITIHRNDSETKNNPDAVQPREEQSATPLNIRFVKSDPFSRLEREQSDSESIISFKEIKESPHPRRCNPDTCQDDDITVISGEDPSSTIDPDDGVRIVDDAGGDEAKPWKFWKRDGTRGENDESRG